MLQNVLWRILRHGHQAPAAQVLTDIRNDPYGFHVELTMIVEAGLRGTADEFQWLLL